jgi:hypothetical protein
MRPCKSARPSRLGAVFSTVATVAGVANVASVAIVMSLLLGLGCQAQRQAGQDVPRQPVPGPAQGPPMPSPPATTTTGDPASTPPPLGAAPLATERALVVENGQERWIAAAEAEQSGYTLIDLSDDWAPLIFAEQVSAVGAPLPNRYRRIFLGLANDQLDEDGQALPPGMKNYLELYGIFPSLTVLRARFAESGSKTCIDEAGKAALEAVTSVSYIPPAAVRRDDLRIAKLRKELEAARRKFRAKTMVELVEKRPELAPKLKLVEKRAADKLALTAVERRLHCEGLLTAKSKHKAGIYDEPIQLAVKRFQQKHMIYESHYLRRATIDALERDLLENDHRSLYRALRERVVAAAAIIEDGTVSAAALGESSNLADAFTDIVVKSLGIDTPQGALDFFKRHAAAGEFTRLRAAVKLPARPAYYSPQMPLEVVIDRGDVWYELPYNEKGERLPQPRKKFPSFTLLVQHNGKKLPLVRWRTTIGGWRAEQASDGYEYFRYKGSDVGERVIRQIVAGAVWIAPASTPIRSLLKPKVVGGRWQKVVNYSELGPGFLSAYGLVAGYFVVPGKNGRGDWDNGIRAHGSAEYLSMYSPTGYSHGCHRLPNHLAIRLYSFVLRHRNMRVVGDLPSTFIRQFLSGEEVYEMKIPSRGFSYQLDPPLPVEVLEGEIKGEQKEPLLGYIPKPGVIYPGPPPPLPGESPEDRAGGGAAGPATGGKPGPKGKGKGKAPAGEPEEEEADAVPAEVKL